MGLLSKIHDFFRGKKGTGYTNEPLQEGHELKLEDTTPKDDGIQTTFNTDNLDALVEEGVVENVICDEN